MAATTLAPAMLAIPMLAIPMLAIPMLAIPMLAIPMLGFWTAASTQESLTRVISMVETRTLGFRTRESVRPDSLRDLKPSRP
jgi:hypothetical protein